MENNFAREIHVKAILQRIMYLDYVSLLGPGSE